MARLYTGGAELDPLSGGVNVGLETNGITGTVTRDTVLFRSGLASWKCDSAAGAGANFGLTSQTSGANPAANNPLAAGATNFVRAYFCFSSLPGSTTRVVEVGGLNTGGANGVSARLTTAGKLQLFNNVAGTQIGSDSAATIAADGATNYRIEIKTVNVAGNFTDCELQLDGVSVATGTGLSIGATTAVYIGWIGSPGANKIVNVDDVAVNDSSGAVNNTFAGSGKVVLLKPISDNARGTGWVNDANAATGFFDATDNTPPQGVAQTTASTGLHQIQNATANANSNVDLNMTSYTTAGVGAADTINVVMPVVATGAPVATSAKLGTVGLVSNPTIANISLAAGGTSGAFWQGAAAGTYPVGWKFTVATVTEAPSVTRGTSPVMRITQSTSSTRIAMVCSMGIYVDYTPAVVAATAIPNVVMAPQRAA